MRYLEIQLPRQPWRPQNGETYPRLKLPVESDYHYVDIQGPFWSRPDARTLWGQLDLPLIHRSSVICEAYVKNGYVEDWDKVWESLMAEVDLSTYTALGLQWSCREHMALSFSLAQWLANKGVGREKTKLYITGRTSEWGADTSESLVGLAQNPWILSFITMALCQGSQASLEQTINGGVLPKYGLEAVRVGATAEPTALVYGVPTKLTGPTVAVWRPASAKELQEGLGQLGALADKKDRELGGLVVHMPLRYPWNENITEKVARLRAEGLVIEAMPFVQGKFEPTMEGVEAVRPLAVYEDMAETITCDSKLHTFRY